MDRWISPYACGDVNIRDPNDKCVCTSISHGYFKFGNDRGYIFDPLFKGDPCAMSHNLYFNPTDFNKYEQHDFFNYDDYYDSKNNIFKIDTYSDVELNKHENEPYFINCDCNYCKYAQFLTTGQFSICFCCDDKIYFELDSIIKCDDCNSLLCNKCFIHGKYNDTRYCYLCRPFSVHKNGHYYFSQEKYKFDIHDDWETATFYY